MTLGNMCALGVRGLMVHRQPKCRHEVRLDVLSGKAFQTAQPKMIYTSMAAVAGREDARS
jgi:hypothetical protein